MNKTIQYLYAGVALLLCTVSLSQAIVEKRLQRERARTELRNLINSATQTSGEAKTRAYQKAQQFISDQIKKGILTPRHVRRTTTDIELELARNGVFTPQDKADLDLIDEQADVDDANKSVEDLKGLVDAAIQERRKHLETLDLKDSDYVLALKAFDNAEEELQKDPNNQQLQENLNKTKNALKPFYETNQEFVAKETELEKQLTKLQKQLKIAEEKAAKEIAEAKKKVDEKKAAEKAAKEAEKQVKEDKEKLVDKIVDLEATLSNPWFTSFNVEVTNAIKVDKQGDIKKEDRQIEDTNTNEKDHLLAAVNKDKDALEAYKKALQTAKDTALRSGIRLFLQIQALGTMITNNKDAETVKNGDTVSDAFEKLGLYVTNKDKKENTTIKEFFDNYKDDKLNDHLSVLPKEEQKENLNILTTFITNSNKAFPDAQKTVATTKLIKEEEINAALKTYKNNKKNK